ncbi:hypothetical protein O3611_04840 [Streptococcus sp. 27098_8_91]|uniref:hypothetical protein n=1 Tax=unclassified Streptococcus TaxID=2608887 RepID=UPI002002E68D|nr:hypothetical protein [Streptococcus sp. oral taxon 431]
MNELDLTNTQAIIFLVVLIGLLLYLNHRDRQKSAQIERENKQTIETPSEDLNPDYGRYIQLAGVNYGEELNESDRE